jgi:small nuclear ribonucleoprotein (snRNP)-like protein
MKKRAKLPRRVIKMETVIVLKNSGFKYNGKFISEDETNLIIQDVKLGKITILKSEIAVRGDY